MAKVKITQIKSVSGQSDRQRRTIQALGLRRMHHSVEKELTPQVKGMIEAVQHLLKVENA